MYTPTVFKETKLERLHELIQAHPFAMLITWDDERNHHMLAGLVAFQMPIERLEGKFKLNQNRTAADRQKVIQSLSASKRKADHDIARLIRENISDSNQRQQLDQAQI